MASRLELIELMKQYEERKVFCQKAMKDAESFYCESVEIMVDIKSTDFNKQHDPNSCMIMDKVLFTNYLAHEISNCDALIEGIIGKLK